jgi:hypothetical protein
MPSKAITLASRLSRTSVMHQIRPVAPKDLKEELARARYMPPYTGEIDPAVEDILCRTTCAVYLGARKGNDPRHLEAARATGALLRELGIAVIYGGAMKGNMGALADAYLGAESEHPSRILAVTPFGILLGEGTAANEGFHPGLTLTIAVPGMQERKMFMTGLSDFTLMLSGGWGSIDEKLEELRLALMNVTTKKMIIFNVGGYWDGFSKLFDEAIRRGYMKKGDLEKITVVNSVRELRHVIMKEIRQSTHPEPTLH